ncbi:MAG: rRNA maturation RNase YbeY [Patescibacteria group bacterium]|nr:rRNA maturation RNase YbeY [Patescibacteria group bacterium]
MPSATGIAIANETRAAIPRAPFSAIARAMLGPRYRLSLVFVSPSRMKKLNAIYRDKDEPTDILSFPLADGEGEIYISPSEARKQAKEFGRTYPNFIAFLFIHGCAHLKGYDHGSTMERIEASFRRRFKI